MVKKIEGILQLVETFKEEYTLSMYPMITSSWHVMMPAEKRNMMNVIDLHGGVFLANFFKALRTEFSITFREIHPMRMCYDLLKTHPDYRVMTLQK